MAEHRVIVWFNLVRLTASRRYNPLARWRTQKQSAMAATLAYRQIGCPESPGRIRVCYELRGPRRMDPDNVIGAAKYILDALCNRTRNGFGFTPNDSDRYVTIGPVLFDTGQKWKGRENVVVHVLDEEGMEE